jgi:hypothetical protein
MTTLRLHPECSVLPQKNVPARGIVARLDAVVVGECSASCHIIAAEGGDKFDPMSGPIDRGLAFSSRRLPSDKTIN